MTWYVAGAVALLIGAGVPALFLASRGDALDRLVGLELGGAGIVPALILLATGYQRPTYLIVPLVLAILSVAGVLVFTRLAGPWPAPGTGEEQS
jgi:multisubunit Na+/H+ antiporter MnhF subunit